MSDLIKSDSINLKLTAKELQFQVDLVQRGLQSRVRAVMAIYGVDREEAERIMNEIYLETRIHGSPVIIPNSTVS